MYKIENVLVRVFYSSDNSEHPYTGAGNDVAPVLQAVVDYDDILPPTASSNLLDYPKVIIKNCTTASNTTPDGSVMHIKCKPKFAGAVAIGEISATAYGEEPKTGF